MTTVYSPVGQCWGKVQYENGRAAKAAIKEVEARWGRRLNKYHCPWCAFYHIGNKVTLSHEEDETEHAEELVDVS